MNNGASGILVVLAAWGAIADFRYCRKGGIGTTRKERRYLVAAILMLLVIMVILGIMGATPYGLGRLTGQVLLVIIWPLWEFGRWRVRRDHPINPRTPQIEK